MSQQTDEIRERLNKATTHRGEWEVRDSNQVQGEDTVAVRNSGVICFVQTARFEPTTFHNADFIAHAPSDLQYLLQRVEKFEKAQAELQCLANECADISVEHEKTGRDSWARFYSGKKLAYDNALMIVKRALKD